MHRLILSRLRRRPGRLAALAAGILVASTSFTLLTASVRTSDLITVGFVGRHARSAYDILVRPAGARTALERRRRLVQDNFSSGIYGGITLAEYHQIEKIPGIDAAAPVANLGYVLTDTFVPVSVRPYLDGAPFQAFRLRLRYVVGGGQRVFPDADLYVYISRADPMRQGGQGAFWEQHRARRLWTCLYFNEDPRGLPLTPGQVLALPFRRNPGLPKVRSAFDHRLRTGLNCASTKASRADFGGPSGFYGTYVDVELPVALAAIDPVQMNRLVGLGRALVSGRMPGENEATVYDPHGPNAGSGAMRGIPVLLSSRPFQDETLEVQAQRLLPARPGDLPARLGAPGAYRYLTHLPGRAVGSASHSLASVFARAGAPVPTTYGAWLPGPVSYRTGPGGTLSVRARGRQQPDVWASDISAQGFDPGAPIDNTAPQVRAVSVVPSGDGGPGTYLPLAVGRFDPGRLRGFSALGQVPLETFRAPQAVGADSASRAALRDQPLLPDRNLGGYLQQPPAMLTTLAAIPYFINSRLVEGKQQRQLAAPISCVMIRVKGVRGIDPLSRARVNAVAAAIHRMFPGLALDVTLGSSPEPQTIALPAGVAAAQAVRVREGWAHLGVALAIVRAVDRKSAVLFVLILVVCGLFLGHAGVASVRARRAEIGALRSLGWSRAEVFASVLAEPAAAGLIAGAAGAALAGLLSWALHLSAPPWYPLLVVPVAVVLSTVSGALPAWQASRIGPLAAMERPVRRIRRARPVRGLARLAVRDLARTPGRTALGALALALGIAALTVLLAVTVAYQGAVSITLLGSAVVTAARGVDYLSAVLALILGAAGAIDVLVISLRERAPELATLRACGWSQGDLARLVLLEGAGIGLLGGLAGAAAGLAAVAAVGPALPPAALAAGAAAAAGGAALVTFAAAIPLARLARLAPVSLLADE